MTLELKLTSIYQDVIFLPIGTSAEDLEMLDELIDEISFSTIAAGVNRKSRRSN